MTNIEPPSGLAKDMTKREAFAMAAMQGQLACSEARGTPEQFAEWSVKYADALIAELAKDRSGL